MTLPVADGQLPDVEDWNTMVPDGTGEWRSYRPRIWDRGGLAYLNLGAGSAAVGRYFRIGRYAISIVRIKFGTSGATFGTGLWDVPPFPGDITGGQDIASPLYSGSAFVRLGTGLAIDVSTGAAHVLVPYAADHNKVGMQSPSPSGGALANVSGTAPFTWAASDELHLHYMYERV